MRFIGHYRDLSTDIDLVYDAMLNELRSNNDLDIVKELMGDINGQHFKTIIAVRNNLPKDFFGSLREISFTITGKPDDYIVEVHTGSWFSNMMILGTGGAVIGNATSDPNSIIGNTITEGTNTMLDFKFHRIILDQVKHIIVKSSLRPMTMLNTKEN
jgi:energy-converting hydrogenase Eha subunit E